MVSSVDCDPETGMEVAGKIHFSIASTGSYRRRRPEKTISISISRFPVDTSAFWKCDKFADVALYHAKESGAFWSDALP